MRKIQKNYKNSHFAISTLHSCLFNGLNFQPVKRNQIGTDRLQCPSCNNVSVCQRTTVQGLKFELSSRIYNLLNGETMVLDVNRKFDLHQYKPVLSGWASLLFVEYQLCCPRMIRELYGGNIQLFHNPDEHAVDGDVDAYDVG